MINLMNMEMPVRVRFAPSPTGFLHVGGLRTALYNYLFALHFGGKLILRIEDTDRSRYVENAVENLVESLNWAGIEFDEGPVSGGDFGPYYQSQRLEIYKKYAETLLSNGYAYYAFDTSEEIEQMRQKQQSEGKDPKYDRQSMKSQVTLSPEEAQRLISSAVPYVIRLKVPNDSEVHFKDIIRGDISINSKDIDDQVLLKSDGFPTYHLANVVDDYLMKITHVIRGEEWLPSTPKHVLLYQAFGWESPQFAHLPLLLNKDKTKLSKRQGSVSVEDFRSNGYIKDAFINFIALLGWNPTADREIFTIDELINLFELEKVNKAGAVFDLQKLTWMNAHYLRNTPAEEYTKELQTILDDLGFPIFDLDYLANVILLLRERVEFLKEIPDFGDYMFRQPLKYDEEYQKKCWTDEAKMLIPDLLETYRTLENFSHQIIHDETMIFVESKHTKLKIIIHPLRLMITGKSAGAGMFETMEVLGKEECITRIEKFLKLYN
jgi:glutamyl-tRNA synthetase